MGDGYEMGLLNALSSQLSHFSRYRMGNHRARPKPILFLPISLRHRHQQCCATSLFPNGAIVGENCAELEDLRHLNQSWPIHDQRTRVGDDYGNCRLPVCICCAIAMFLRPCF